MKSSITILVACALLLAVAGCQGGGAPAATATPPESETFAWVNGTPIAKEQVDQFLAGVPAPMRAQMASPAGMANVIENLVRIELVYQKALADGYAARPEIQQRIEQARRQVIYGSYLQDELAKLPQPDDAEIRRMFEETPQFAGQDFEKVKPQIAGFMMRQQQEQALDDITNKMKAAATVRYNEKLMPQAPPPMMPPAGMPAMPAAPQQPAPEKPAAPEAPAKDAS